ncbi:uncharacterized protein LOC129782511 [Toxorhynchites rutilus septentrionalis]|uniref:uncharacterized protein LOC129782511 n=1 Tax=Toxorhynchites rutilus septentrionalis TaxID=329112 RepID=UPI00247B1E67|nr:uncharacterized protein LOC129782511 [Toxorhynchites rutilus septentrionalis]
MSKSPSSETTSETLSVSDESIATSVANSVALARVNAAKPAKKAVKEEAKERPPWRPATQTKVGGASKMDLRARILDVSKRLRRVNAAAQTDPVRTKLMRDASTEEQKDLIPMMDEEILTDGNLVMRNAGNLILTHSVAQMTDTNPTRDVGTQTAMPRSAVSFRKFLEPAGSEPISSSILEDTNYSSSFEELMKIREWSNSADEDVKPIEENQFASRSDAINEQNTPDLLAGSSQDPELYRPRFLEPPTYNSWQNLDFSDEESDHYVARELPRRTVGEGDRPWAEFKDLVIGSRLANMRLSPITPRRARPNKKTVTWSDTHRQAFSELLQDANALVDMFDQVSMLLGPDVKLHAIPLQEEFKLPPPKWEPILTKSCDLLEEKLAQIRHLNDDLDSELFKEPIEFQSPQFINDIEASL